ncbi:nucleoside-diphosphate kinase [Apibacter muscae]|uniref:Nucleoside diphosphate kinase n=1 Tax=Apibacter muscae TaxID=2509004 RepID=A0A563DEL9_9FLAO|nr:nucleoside-diphosphate kinase [Apibacter muscae]TWP24337.1 nucleoside-diphosphate kinase [Apibacter muscae]TWP28650.1 nucleoside-diphosphate kinase [Apibacter muscae]TWP30101.1 nucleoside-diphosphate kinase [Apibacter muscae]
MINNKNLTLTMIKPDAVKNGYMGNIINDITNAGFTIIALRLTQLTSQDAKKFYSIHKDKPFFKNLVEFMTSGPIVAAVLKKENAVEEFRKLIGATNPKNAEEGTLRKKYAESMERNAIHGSDSDENARIESLFHFAEKEIYLD